MALQGDGPTCAEGAFGLMKLALDSFAPKMMTNLVRLDLQKQSEEDNVDVNVVHLLRQSTYSILSIEYCRPEGRLGGSLVIEYLLSNLCYRVCLHIFRQPLPQNLTELRISAELCYGLIRTNFLAQVRDTVSVVWTLIISPGRWLLSLWTSLGTSVNARDLETLLAPFPSLTTLSVCTRYLIQCTRLECILGACSQLRKLYLHSRAFGSVHGLLVQLRIFNVHQRLEVLLLDCPCDITHYHLVDVQNLPILRYVLLRLGSSIRLVSTWIADIFERLPSLEWFVYISSVECRTFVCSRMSTGSTPEFAVLETDKILDLIPQLPQLLSIFWERLLDLA
ncbi:unnamed protein product [Schistocephalus solidus]|uniref:F-box domain-containing protein n=1 Tax=Schistocephalus solidus TaxID=70667 RepID=A0A183T5D8_SCHSO|nr:unnamed protein product [Schistocephalus solidus]